MMVLNNECKKCYHTCNAIYFQQNFVDWTSGNDYIDKFIQDSQLSVHVKYGVYRKTLEWIPYDRFNNIIIKSRFGEIYRANWIDGCIYKWDDENQNWKRNENMVAILKILNNPKNITLKFMNKVQFIT